MSKGSVQRLYEIRTVITAHYRRAAPVRRGFACAVALALCVELARAATHGSHPGARWLDLTALPVPLATAVLLGTLVALVIVAVAPVRSSHRSLLRFAPWPLWLAALWCVRDAWRVADALGTLELSLSVWLAVIFGALAAHASHAAVSPRILTPLPRRRTLPVLALATVTCSALLALGQMRYLGQTSYARPVDAIVVLGARVYASGAPSLALADRVLTACELAKAGFSTTIVVSGGPGDGDIHETDTMKRLASNCGAPEILVDRGGVGTWQSAQHSARLLGPRARVLVVSHGYHLPRSRLAFESAGLMPYTVPATETRPLTKLPYFLAREVVAYWIYSVWSIAPNWLAPSSDGPPTR